MQEYDVALKLLLQGSAKLTMRELTGTAIAKWLDVELPKVQNLRLDLLGQTVDGGLIHLELQRSNDAAMPFRMIEYCLGVQRRSDSSHGRFSFTWVKRRCAWRANCAARTCHSNI